MKKIYLCILSLLMASYAMAQAQEFDPLKENITIDIDNIGDAHVTVSRSYNASQWDNFQKIYGSNAAEMLKREEERALPGFYLTNWNYKDGGSDRNWTLQFDALGLAKIDDNGNWQVDMDQKNPDITKISDRNYAMTTTWNSYGVLVQEITKINLPEGASNITQDKNAFGKAMFTYEMTPGRKGAHMIFIIIGMLLIAASVVIYFKPHLPTGKQKVKPFTVVSSQPAPAATVDPPANPNIEKQA